MFYFIWQLAGFLLGLIVVFGLLYVIGLIIVTLIESVKKMFKS